MKGELGQLKGEKFMSAKVKLISFISAFVLLLGIVIIGVLSAEKVKVNIGGSVSFNATNVYAKVRKLFWKRNYTKV